MRYEIYQNEELINTIVADEEFISAYILETGYTAVLVEEPEPEATPEPTPQDDTDALLVDHEFRLTVLELGV